MSRTAHARNLRLGRHSEVGRIYHISVTCRNRQRIFAAAPKGRAVVHAMRELEDAAGTLCFVVMPDHVHWLFELKEGANLSAVVQKLKSLVTRRLHRQWGHQGAIWQAGFHDRAIRREEKLPEVAHYIVHNPVRAGLVHSARQYPLWDSKWYDRVL